MLDIMRCTLLLFICFLALRVMGSSMELTNWVGRYPFDTDNQKHTIYQTPKVQAALKRLLTPEELKLLTSTYSECSPITRIQDYLVIGGCMPHCCPCEHAMLVIDLPHDWFHVGFYRHEAGKNTVKWISSAGEFQDLPKEVQEEFYFGHNPK
jgi:hypothetical protein